MRHRPVAAAITVLVGLTLIVYARAAVDPGTLKGKVIVGYQGWFSCPDDKTGTKNWGHWLTGEGTLAVDAIPETSELPQQAGCRAPFIRDAMGKQVMLYSAQNLETVNAQFRWLKNYDISGVAVQRFVSELTDPVLKQARDTVLYNVKSAAERNGRLFFITYDISGAQSNWDELIRRDWEELSEGPILASPSYLHERGRPLLEIWGMGWPDRPATPVSGAAMMRYFGAPASTGLSASILLGVPATWRDQAKVWTHVYSQASAISPWIIGNLRSAEDQRALLERMQADVALTQKTGQLYIPVIFPGFSAFNQSHGQEKFDDIPRGCGKFMQMQIDSVLSVSVEGVYVAMFDEANEGTAIFKSRVDPLTSKSARILEQSKDCKNESSLYLKLAAELARGIRVRQPN